MNASSFRVPTGPASVCNTPAASIMAGHSREPIGSNFYNSSSVISGSRRPSYAYSNIQHSQANIPPPTKNPYERHNQMNSTIPSMYERHNLMNGATPAMPVAGCNGWNSYQSDMSVPVPNARTPITDGKFRTSFSFRQAKVPEGYPKLDFERNPRRESCISEFSRKLAEGYDIWYDEDRPVINWRYPQMPIRANRTHDLRLMANRERINKMMEREKQMNKRTNTMMKGPSERKDTAWWEQARKQRPSNAFRGTQIQTSRVPWTGGTPQRPSNYNTGSLYTPRR